MVRRTVNPHWTTTSGHSLWMQPKFSMSFLFDIKHFPFFWMLQNLSIWNRQKATRNMQNMALGDGSLKWERHFQPRSRMTWSHRRWAKCLQICLRRWGGEYLLGRSHGHYREPASFFSLDTTSRVRSQSWTKLPFSAFGLILDCEIVLNNHHHQIHIQSHAGVRRQVNFAMMPLVKFLVQATQHVGGSLKVDWRANSFKASRFWPNFPFETMWIHGFSQFCCRPQWCGFEGLRSLHGADGSHRSKTLLILDEGCVFSYITSINESFDKWFKKHILKNMTVQTGTKFAPSILKGNYCCHEWRFGDLGARTRHTSVFSCFSLPFNSPWHWIFASFS